MKKTLLIALVLVMASNGFAQSTKQKTVLIMTNDTVVNCHPEFSSVKIDLKYGKLNVPSKDILKITMGYHCENDLKGKIDSAVKDLGSNVHLTRDTADKFLRGEFEHSYFPLKNFISGDREVSRRIQDILTFIEINKEPKLFKRPPEDKIYLYDGSVYSGQLLEPLVCEFSTANLGKINAPVSGIREILFYNEQVMKLVISGEKEWFKLDKHIIGKFTVRASGSIDLYPSEPDKYLTGPNGSDVGGLQTDYKGGLLVVRYNGITYRCGELYSGESTNATMLEFSIIRPYWANNTNGLPMSGEYKIEVSQ